MCPSVMTSILFIAASKTNGHVASPAPTNDNVTEAPPPPKTSPPKVKSR